MEQANDQIREKSTFQFIFLWRFRRFNMLELDFMCIFFLTVAKVRFVWEQKQYIRADENQEHELSDAEIRILFITFS